MLSLTQNFYIIKLEMMSRTFFQTKRFAALVSVINASLFKNTSLILYYPLEGQMKKVFFSGLHNFVWLPEDSRAGLSSFSFKYNSPPQGKEEK